MELAIDTSTATASLALAQEGAVLAELTWRCGQNHSQQLLLSLNYLMGLAGVEKLALTGIIVARGPGSFNGLRVGMATAKGLAYALGLPLVGISTLEVEAFPHLETGLPVCPLQVAGRGEVAVALFQKQGEQRLRLWEEQLTTVAELAQRLTQETLRQAQDIALFCGEISTELAASLKDSLGDKARIASSASRLRRAGFLAELGWARLSRGERDDPATLQPIYLRRPPITLPKSSRGEMEPHDHR